MKNQIVFLTAFLVVQALAAPLCAAEQPNIIFLFSDDQTALAAGCAAHEAVGPRGRADHYHSSPRQSAWR